MNSRFNLKIFFSISLSIHLFLFSVVSILYPEFKINKLPPLNLEVSLILPVLPVVAEEKANLKSISTPPSPQSIVTNIPLEEPKPLPIENGKWEMGNGKEEKAEKELVTKAMSRVLASDLNLSIWSDEKPLPLQENSSKAENLSISLTPYYSEKMKGTPSPHTDSQETSLIVSKLKPSSGENTVFAQPRYAENPKPLYPQEARKNGYEGEVLLKVEVLANGRVGQVEVKKSSGYETLDRSALTAVKQWKFIPANQGNGAIPCWVNIPIKFQLQ
jgi:TonB family protein